MKNFVLRFLGWSFLLVVFVYYYFADVVTPNAAGISCMFKRFTGFSCSGCGTQRALHYLLHFQFIKALQLNAIFIIGFPFLIGLYYTLIEVYITRTKKPEGFYYKTQTGIIVLVITLLFTVLRNIPYYPFLYLKD